MLVMADRDGFDGAAFDDGVSLVGGVSMLLMLDRESVGEAGGVGEADLVWWSRTCSCSLVLLANLAEQRRHAKASRRAFSSAR